MTFTTALFTARSKKICFSYKKAILKLKELKTLLKVTKFHLRVR